MLSKEIWIPIYEQSISVSVCGIVEFKSLMKSRYNADINISKFAEAWTGELTNHSECKRVLSVFFNTYFIKDQKEYLLMQLIGHESVHLVDFVMEHAGIKNDPLNNEARAYLTGYITQKLYITVNELLKEA